MPARDITRKTDAELARLCAVHSTALTRLQNKISARKNQDPDLAVAFDQAANLLDAAIAELQARTDRTSRITPCGPTHRSREQRAQASNKEE